jgi:hypothetical protein
VIHLALGKLLLEFLAGSLMLGLPLAPISLLLLGVIPSNMARSPNAGKPKAPYGCGEPQAGIDPGEALGSLPPVGRKIDARTPRRPLPARTTFHCTAACPSGFLVGYWVTGVELALRP